MKDGTRKASRTKSTVRNQSAEQFSNGAGAESGTYRGIMQCLDGGFCSAGKVAKGIVTACALPGVVLPVMQAYAADIAPADGVTVSSGDSMTLPGSGTSTVSNVSVSGGMYVSAGGEASSTMVDNGSLNVSAGGIAVDTIVNNDGGINIYSGGVASNTTINATSAHGMTINSDGLATSTTVNSGAMFVFGGMASATEVNSGQVFVTPSDGAIKMSDTTINGGRVYVSSGSIISSTTINGGSLFVRTGASATDVHVNGTGSINAGDDASLSDVSINVSNPAYGVSLWGSSTVTNAIIDDGNLRLTGASSATDTTLNGGIMEVAVSSTATGTTLNGGEMNVSWGGLQAIQPSTAAAV